MQKILLLEDFEDTRLWLTELLLKALPGSEVTAVSTINEARKVIAEAATGESATPGQNFSLAVLDLNLPDGNGLEIATMLRQEYPDTYVVISTIYDDDNHVFDALQAGVQGYLLKEQPEPELIKKIQGIARGEPPLTPAVARKILRYFQRMGAAPGFDNQSASNPVKSSANASAIDNASGLVEDVDGVGSSQPRHQLTPREVEVLTLVAKGLSRKEIARLLEITPHTASGYIKTIYQKLNISSRSEAAIEATRLGFVRV